MTTADWIKRRRELLDDATSGPWVTTADGADTLSAGFNPDGHLCLYAGFGWDDDAALIADARTSLPMALDALHGVLAKHYEGDSSQGYAPNGDYVDLGPCCETCGTNGEYGVPWPCPTARAIATALGVEP